MVLPLTLATARSEGQKSFQLKLGSPFDHRVERHDLGVGGDVRRPRAVQVGDVRRLAARDRREHLLQRVVAVAGELDVDCRVGVRGVELLRERFDRDGFGAGVALPNRDRLMSAGAARGAAAAGARPSTARECERGDCDGCDCALHWRLLCVGGLAQHHRPREVLRVVWVKSLRFGQRDGRALRADELGHRVDVVVKDGRSGHLDVGHEALVAPPEDPHERLAGRRR